MPPTSSHAVDPVPPTSSHTVDPVPPPPLPPPPQYAFTVRDIGAYTGRPAVGGRTANGWLKRFRETLPDGFHDLTERPDIDWRGYLAHHKQVHELVGDGVLAFGVLNMPDVRDPNFPAGRTDFVVIRGGGSAGEHFFCDADCCVIDIAPVPWHNAGL